MSQFKFMNLSQKENYHREAMDLRSFISLLKRRAHGGTCQQCLWGPACDRAGRCQLHGVEIWRPRVVACQDWRDARAVD